MNSISGDFQETEEAEWNNFQIDIKLASMDISVIQIQLFYFGDKNSGRLHVETHLVPICSIVPRLHL